MSVGWPWAWLLSLLSYLDFKSATIAGELIFLLGGVRAVQWSQ